MTRLREVQRFEQFFWDRIGTETKAGDVQKVVAMVESNPWLRRLVDLLGDLQDKRVLDCGCGVGNLSGHLAMRDAHVEGRSC